MLICSLEVSLWMWFREGLGWGAWRWWREAVVGSQATSQCLCVCERACARVFRQPVYITVCVCVQAWAQSLSRVRLFVTPWIIACQAPLSMGFPREEYWSGLPFHSPGDLLDPGIESVSPALVGKFFTTAPPGKPLISQNCDLNDSQGSQVESYRQTQERLRGGW